MPAEFVNVSDRVLPFCQTIVENRVAFLKPANLVGDRLMRNETVLLVHFRTHQMPMLDRVWAWAERQ